jgi:hypothetical protein
MADQISDAKTDNGGNNLFDLRIISLHLRL